MLQMGATEIKIDGLEYIRIPQRVMLQSRVKKSFIFITTAVRTSNPTYIFAELETIMGTVLAQEGTG
jgi:hypothetical protein